MSLIPNEIIVDPISLTVTEIELSNDITFLAKATGFFYKSKDKVYLITNWHNFSRTNPFTRELLDGKAAYPETVGIKIRLNTGKIFLLKQPLYFDKEHCNPKWFVHPVFKDQVDVVALEVTNILNANIVCINDFSFDDDISPDVGDECFVIGYPLLDEQPASLPIWKKASIASEPKVNQRNLPFIYVDSATRPGLSGSIVIMQRIGIHRMENGKLTGNSLIGRIRVPLGIYSGRIGVEDLGQFQLGIVWKFAIIDDIINCQTLGTNAFQHGK